MKKKGLTDSTIRNRSYNLNKLLDLGADLTNPESIETILATENLGKPYKKALANAYKAYAEYIGITWKKPKITVTPKEVFLPTDEEVTQLIAGAGKTTRTLLQLIYETAPRIGEASQIEWTDINFKDKTLSINHAEKGSNNRTLPISDLLISMLHAMKKRKNNLIFNPNVKTLSSSLDKSRTRVTKELNNPRIQKIHFHTLRHLRATKEFYKTKDIMHVKYFLGHKAISSTQRYIHYTPFQKDEYHCSTAHNTEEAINLIENGFEYITEMNGTKLFRKRK